MNHGHNAESDAGLIREHFADGATPYHCVDCIEPREQAALDAVLRLLADAERAEAALDEEIANRDNAQEWADRLAYAIAPVEEIGEHTSHNNPWENALAYTAPAPEAMLTPAEVAALADVVTACENGSVGFSAVCSYVESLIATRVTPPVVGNDPNT